MTKKEFFAKAAIAFAQALIKPQDECATRTPLNPSRDDCGEIASAACKYAYVLMNEADREIDEGLFAFDPEP